MAASPVASNILRVTQQLNSALQLLHIENHIPAVSHIYYPLQYAYDPYENYVNKYCNGAKSVLFVGMNPSPHGMCQTGIPFGDVNYVKNWLKIGGEVKIPPIQHPNYPISGYSHTLTEISGSRFWGFLSKHFREPENFFEIGFVVNYCPVALISDRGYNLTPESREIQDHPIKQEIESLCSASMREIIHETYPEHIIGIGRYATRLCQDIVDRTESEIQVHYLRHPSPRSVQNVNEWEQSFLLLLKQNNLFSLNR